MAPSSPKRPVSDQKLNQAKKLAKSIEEDRKRLESLSARRAANVQREETSAQAVYSVEATVARKVGFGPKVIGIAGAQEFVEGIVKTPQWRNLVGPSPSLKNIQVVSINDPAIKDVLADFFSPAEIKETFALTLKGIDGWIIALNPKQRYAYTELVLIHELAHVAVAPYDHNQHFQGLYIDLVYEFMVKRGNNFGVSNRYMLWKNLRDQFIENKLKTTYFRDGHVCGHKETLPKSPQPLNLRIDVILENKEKRSR